MSVGIVGWKPVTILNGASLSASLFITGLQVIAMRQPAGIEGTSFTFQASFDGGTTFEDLQTDSAELSVTKSATVAQTFYLPSSKAIFGPTHIKVRTGASGAPSAQDADATIWLALLDVEAANGG